MSSVVFSVVRGVSFVLAVLCYGFFPLSPLSSQAVGNITLAWDPSPSADIAGYNVYYGGASATYTNMLSAGNATQLTIPGLVEGPTYYFAATAYDSFGLESDFSEEISYSINSPNHPPAISPISNIVIVAGTTTTPIPFSIEDAETPAINLMLSAFSDNSALVPAENIAFGGSDTNRTAIITPLTKQMGIANITITVSDGTDTASSSFQLDVLPGDATPPVLQPPVIAEGVVLLTWSAMPGRIYQVEFCSDLNSSAWTVLGDPIVATDATMSTTDPLGPDPRRFYRVSLLPSIASVQNLTSTLNPIPKPHLGP